MAHPILQKSTIPHFLVFPTLHQVYVWRVADERNPDLTVSRHKELEFAVLKAHQLNKLYAKRTPILSQCVYESTESSWGACDGGVQCNSIATVHHLEFEHDVCLEHFRELERL